MSENNVVFFRQKDEIDDPLTKILRCAPWRSHGSLKSPPA